MTTNPYRLPSTVVPSAYRIFLTPDLENFTFSGRVEIDVHVHESVTSFALNAIELELGGATLTSGGVAHHSTDLSTNEEYQTATFTFDSPLPVGDATIELAFKGILNDQLHGFYRSTYTDESGTTHTIATTQFESTDARRAFPCWDEPSFKATYQVNLTIPSHLAAYSNSAAVSDTDLGNGQRSVVFAPTMKMSTYLVAFVVGPFEATEPIDVGGVPVRVIFPIGKGRLATYALEVAEHALSFFSDYFDIPYPGDKFDLIAIPDFAAGAMENLGLVTFRETDLLIDPERASFAQIERVALVINHETAHMWFGDLVTMDWWEGIWLNEAFATFMESICTDHFRPQWKKWVGFNALRDMAMAVDSLHSTRPIEYEVISPDDCRGMFDVLTYMKGCAVLRMLEQYLGEETFRDGIRAYLRKHSYANTVTQDLWNALEEASGQPVGTIMNTWILQGGFPLVSVSGGTVRQEPFHFTEASGTSNIGALWQVPILSRPLGGDSVAKQLLSESSAPLATSGSAVVNAGGSGFYRVAYGTAELAEISSRLSDLSDIERVQLFSDTNAAMLMGHTSIADLLRLAAGLGDLNEPSAWTVVENALMMVRRLVDDEGADVLATVVRQLLRPQFERLGWDPSEGESEQAGELRGLVIRLLGDIGNDREIVEEALRRFDANEVTGDLAQAIMGIAVRENRPGDLNVMEERRRSAATPQDEQLYLFGPAATPDPQAALALFERCFTDIRNQDAPYVIAVLIRSRINGEMIWRKFRDRFDEAVALFPMGMPAASVSGVAALIADPALAAEIRTFHTEHPLPVAQRQVEQVLERMDIGVAFGQKVRAQLTAQLRTLL